MTNGNMSPRIAFIYSYYNCPTNLARQLELWTSYPRELREQVHFILVDDGSRTPISVPVTVHTPG